MLGAGLVVFGHARDVSVAFYVGLPLLSIGLFGISGFTARQGWAPLAFLTDTAVWFLVALVALEVMWRAFGALAEPEELADYYTFESARGKQALFRRWHERYMQEWERTRHDYLMPDPQGVLPFVPRPGSVGTFYRSEWRINRLGFRGPEIEREKGDHFRIVALGESTTFGATLNPQDLPWTEVLEQRIAAELVCERSVQVINAGVPGFTLANNLSRMRGEILPLEPDLILSYHGYNGFPYILQQIPPVRVGNAPRLHSRPSQILARGELAIRQWWFRRRYREARAIDAADLQVDLKRSRYADLYRRLMILSGTHGVETVLLTFNMAVDADSSAEVIRFYEPMIPDVWARVLANRLHTRLVHEIAGEFDALSVDTSADLDGAYRDAFIDVAHYTQPGRERLAANIFDGVRDLLAERNGCHPRGG